MEVSTMQCRLCKKVIYIKRNFRNLMYTETPEICSHCFNKQMNYFPYFVVPINQGLLHIFELLSKDTNNPGDYIYYLRPYYQAYFKLNMTIDAVYIETLTTKFIELFDLMKIGHLIIFTNNFKEE